MQNEERLALIRAKVGRQAGEGFKAKGQFLASHLGEQPATRHYGNDSPGST